MEHTIAQQVSTISNKILDIFTIESNELNQEWANKYQNRIISVKTNIIPTLSIAEWAIFGYSIETFEQVHNFTHYSVHWISALNRIFTD